MKVKPARALTQEDTLMWTDLLYCRNADKARQGITMKRVALAKKARLRSSISKIIRKSMKIQGKMQYGSWKMVKRRWYEGEITKNPLII